MAITNGYCTLADLKARIFTDTPSVDAARDALIEGTIEAASRWIDTWTGHQFFATTATRYFTADHRDWLPVPDLLTVTTLKTDDDGNRVYETTWAATDYDLHPFNNPPYQWIELPPNGLKTFPLYARGVEIAGTWGYASATPDAVNEACLLLAARLWKRKDTILGVSGVSQLGQLTVKVPVDDDIRGLLAAYMRIGL